MAVLQMDHRVDPKKAIMDKLPKDFDKAKFMSNQLLVGTYIRPDEKTKGGLYIPNKSRDEDKFQGTVGLVIYKGPTAFMDDESYHFHGQNVEVGEWCWFKVGDGIRGELATGLHVRLLEDIHIKGVVPHPEFIW